MSLLENASSPTWKNYVDINADVKPYLQYPATDTARDVTLQYVIDFVCQESQRLLGKPVPATPFFFRFDGWSGWNGAYLMLPYYPILEVQAVTEWWGTSGPHVLTESTPENQVDGFQVSYRTGMLIRVYPGNIQKPWFPGSRSIEVTWTAGYNPIPAMYKVPALEIIAEWWRETQQASRSSVAPSGYQDIVNDTSDTYAGLPRRVREVFASQAQVGIG